MRNTVEKAKCEICWGTDHEIKDCLGIRNFRIILYSDTRDHLLTFKRETMQSLESDKQVARKTWYHFIRSTNKYGKIIGCIRSVLRYCHAMGEISYEKTMFEYQGLEYVSEYFADFAISHKRVVEYFIMFGFDKAIKKAS